MSAVAKITIEGRVISKKNSRKSRSATNKKTGKRYTFMVPSDAFEDFEETALWQLKACRERFTGDVCIHYAFEIKGKMRIDVDNAIASINDILQKAGIIDNDENVIKGSFEKIRGAQDWKTRLIIEKI